MAARRRQAARRHWPDNLYQNADGYYWFKNPLNGKTKGLGRDFKAAASRARAANTEISRLKGEADLVSWVKSDAMTLARWCDLFEERYRQGEGRKPSTLKTMAYQFNVIRNASFAGKNIREVTTSDISDWLEETAKKHPTMATLVRARAMALFKSAEAKGHIELGKNPVTPTERPRVVVTRSRLSLDEFQAILAKAREADGMRWLENVMLLGLVSGQRREDLVRMQFAQAREGFLWVQQGKGRSGHETKMRIPLSLYLPQLGLTLDDVLKQCRDKIVSKSVIHHVRHAGRSKPGDPVRTHSVSEVFAQYRDLAEIKTPAGKTPTSFHEIRSLAARLYAETYGEEFARALLGHKSAKMTALYRDSRGQEWTEIRPKVG